jgi:hypothetical protein
MESLKVLSARLLEKEVVDSDELKAVIEETSPSPQIVPGTETERKRHEEEEAKAEGRRQKAE